MTGLILVLQAREAAFPAAFRCGVFPTGCLMKYAIRATGNGGSLRKIGEQADICDAIVIAILHGCRDFTSTATIWDNESEKQVASISRSKVEIMYKPTEAGAADVVEHISALAALSAEVLGRFAMSFLTSGEY